MPERLTCTHLSLGAWQATSSSRSSPRKAISASVRRLAAKPALLLAGSTPTTGRRGDGLEPAPNRRPSNGKSVVAIDHPLPHQIILLSVLAARTMRSRVISRDAVDAHVADVAAELGAQQVDGVRRRLPAPSIAA